MQPLSPIVLTGKYVNEKFKGSRRPDPYLKTRNAGGFGTPGSMHKRGAKSLVPQNVIDDIISKASRLESERKSRGTVDAFNSTGPTSRLPELMPMQNMGERENDGMITGFGSTIPS